MKRRTVLKGMGASLALPFAPAIAQSRPIRMIVPLPAGSSNDTSTRTISQVLGPILGQNIIVENKAGAEGVIGTMDVVRAKPDGLTLMCGSLSPLAINMATMKSPTYDPRKDLTTIATTTVTNHVMVVAPNSPIRTFADFIETAKKRPGEVTIGYSTSLVQLQIAAMERMAGIKLLAVPYKGAPASVTEVMGGSLMVTMANPGPTIGFENGGRLRVLGVTSLKRNPLTPNWPALSETLPGFDYPAWNAIVGPAGIPADLVNRLNAAIVQSLNDAEVVKRLGHEATIPLIKDAEASRAYIAAEVEKFVKAANEAGIEPK